MPLSFHLEALLRDAVELDRIHAQLKTGNPGRQYGLASLNRAALVYERLGMGVLCRGTDEGVASGASIRRRRFSAHGRH